MTTHLHNVQQMLSIEETPNKAYQTIRNLKAFAAVRAYQAHQYDSIQKRHTFDDWVEEHRIDLKYIYQRFVGHRMPYRIFIGLAYRCTETNNYSQYIARGSLNNNFLTVNTVNRMLSNIRDYCWYKGIALFNRNNSDMILLSASFH